VSKLLERLSHNQRKLISWLSLAVLIGVGLFAAQPSQKSGNPAGAPQASAAPPGEAFAAEARYLEQRLAELISAVAGVKRADVFITLDRGTRLHIAQEQTVEEHAGTQIRNSSSPVLLRSGQSEQPIVLQTDWPQIRGVLVVADGADDPGIRYSIAKAVQTVLQIEMYRIEVLPRD